MQNKFPHFKMFSVTTMLVIVLSASSFAMEADLARGNRATQEEALRQAELNRDARTAATDRAGSPTQQGSILPDVLTPTTVPMRDKAAAVQQRVMAVKPFPMLNEAALSQENFRNVLKCDLARLESEQSNSCLIGREIIESTKYLLDKYSPWKDGAASLKEDQDYHQRIMSMLDKAVKFDSNGEEQAADKKVEEIESYVKAFMVGEGDQAADFIANERARAEAEAAWQALPSVISARQEASGRLRAAVEDSSEMNRNLISEMEGWSDSTRNTADEVEALSRFVDRATAIQRSNNRQWVSAYVFGGVGAALLFFLYEWHTHPRSFSWKLYSLGSSNI